MQTMNLKTTLTAYPKLSSSLLSNYVTKDELDNELGSNYLTKTQIRDMYVPEVEDVDSDNVYARNGKDRKWVQLRKESVATDIEVYFGANTQTQMDSVEEIKALQEHVTINKDEKTFMLEYLQQSNGILWICTTRPVRAIQWSGYLWGDYSKQKDDVVDGEEAYYCYRSNEVLLDNLWEFKLIF